ncbi:hypothetical protein VTP01DRAFT_4017 [Rhizomucor pusillus]|uniref:uncharacterized protein n=1 Tax=Rhizomucor pusillus TaxID=4840 RepID=UPI0037429E53
MEESSEWNKELLVLGIWILANNERFVANIILPVYKHLSDLLDVVFDANDIVDSNWANKAMEGDSEHLNHVTYKPDYMVYFRYTKGKKNLFTAEVKPIARQADAVNDTVKLGYELKLMMDRLLAARVPSAVVCGLVVKGSVCAVYAMDFKYEAIYRMTKCCEFELPYSLKTIPLLPQAVEGMLQLRGFVEDAANGLIRKHSNQAIGLKASSKTLTPKRFRRESFGPHEKIIKKKGKPRKV